VYKESSKHGIDMLLFGRFLVLLNIPNSCISYGSIFCTKNKSFARQEFSHIFVLPLDMQKDILLIYLILSILSFYRILSF